MARMPDEWYKAEAARRHQVLREAPTAPGVEVSAAAPPYFRETVSKGTDPGAWVMMWAWVPDPPEGTDGEGTRAGA